MSLKRLMTVIASGIRSESAARTLSAVNSYGSGLWGWIREPFSGAWQRNVEIDEPRSLLSFSAVFSCVTRIANDIAKLRLKLVEEDAGGIGVEVKDSPLLPVLRKPNGYQNRIQFLATWILSKLLNGNTYVLKVRDNRGGENRGIVVRLYILDPHRVTPLVAETGDVYYKLTADNLTGLEEGITVPASEIIHDRWNCLWHPLVGVSPIYACGLTATMGNRIQGNSTKFFENMSRPSGVLTAPGTIDDVTANRLKQHWENNFSGNNMGRVAVLGDNLKYEPMVIPAQEAQLIEQLKWTVEDVARCFNMPLFKIGGPVPTGSSVEVLNQIYYSDCLQIPIEDLELCLDEGLGLPTNRYVELDLDGLMRMDQMAMIMAEKEAVAAAIKTPNEARARLNLKPATGGDSLMMQQQNYSLGALAKRDARPDPFAAAATPKAPLPEPDADADEDVDEDAEEFGEAMIRKFSMEAPVAITF